MSKYRVYEIAKDYNTTSKVIIDILARNGIVAKNHMTSIDNDAKVVIERTFARKTGPTPVDTQTERPAQKPVSASLGQGITDSRPVPAARPAQNMGQDANRSSQSVPPRPPVHQQQPQRPFNDQRPQGQQGGYDRRPPMQQQGQQGGYDRRPPMQQQGQQGGYDRRPPMQQQGQQGGYDRRPPMQQQGQQGGYDRRPPMQQQGQQGGYDRRPPMQQQGQQGGYDRRPPMQQQGQQGGYDRRPPMQPGGNRPPYNNQNNRPGEQSANRNPNFNAASRPGGAPARPQTAPAGNQPTQARRKPEVSGQQIQREKQQHQREQIFSKKHEQRRGPAGKHHNRSQAAAPVKQEPVRPKLIKLGDSITVKDLAAKLGRQVSDVIKKLMMLGTMATINQELDFDTAALIAGEFGCQVEQLPPEESAYEIAEIEDDPATLLNRPPVVTIMGHVDHGKTSLLDAIRQTHVTSSEAGGITQHIGAYQVNYQGKKIVFLDTPGHEAFTAMRARGAQVTDIAILVVAADDGVMPQTIEALNHAKSAQVPIIVAVNKMDKADANPDRVKQQLSEHGLVPEDWGGETIFVPVSAYKKSGISDLLEMILLVSEIQDLKANPNRDAVGTIIEAQLDKGRGPVATVLIQKGTLHIGDTIIAGTAFGKVRAMLNDRGEKVKKAEPSMPVEVLGLSDVPQAGDVLVVAEEKVVRAVAEKRVAKKRTDEMQHTSKVSLDDLFKQIQEGQLKDLNIVVKADVQGSIEALRQALQNLKNKEVRVNIVHSGVGAINESDVMLASASNALIIGFNVRPDNNARKASENEKIDIRTYRVIYEALNDVEAAMSGMLAPEYKEVVLGRAEVRQLISVPKTVVAGSYVLEGKITNSSQIRLIRGGIVVHEGKIEALRRFKDDVKEVASGYECGISLERFRDIREGDILEAFTMELVK